MNQREMRKALDYHVGKAILEIEVAAGILDELVDNHGDLSNLGNAKYYLKVVRDGIYDKSRV